MQPGERDRMILGTGMGFRKIRSLAELDPTHCGRHARVEWPKVDKDGSLRMVMREARLLRWSKNPIKVRFRLADTDAEVDFSSFGSFVLERLRKKRSTPPDLALAADGQE